MCGGGKSVADIIWSADFVADPEEDYVPSDVLFTPSYTVYDRIIEVIRSDDKRIVEVLGEEGKIIEQI